MKSNHNYNYNFNELDRLITDISNNRVRKGNTVERLNKSISDLTQLKKTKY